MSSLLIENKDLIKEYDYSKNTGIDLEALTLGSRKKIWWKCSRGHEWEAQVCNRSRGSNCPYCSNRKVLSGYNDLATIDPEIAQEWHPTKNGPLTPNKVTSKSGRKVWWLGSCGHEWQAVISHRTDGQNCPICSNHVLHTGFNDLATKNPSIAEEWHPKKNGTLTPRDVFPMSNRKVWWMGKCGHEWLASISGRTRNKNGCPICSGHYIKPGINDLLTINPTLSAEWDYEKNKSLSPSTVSPNTHKKAWWICSQCGNHWIADIHHRNAGAGCPICAAKQAAITKIQNSLASGNSLAINNPMLTLEWNTEKNKPLMPTDVLPSSNKKVWWRCKNGHEWQAIIASRNDGAGCPYCDLERKTSFPEQAVLYYFSLFFQTRSRQKVYGKELDVYIPSINVGIEYDGRFYHNTEKSKERDLKKTQFLSEKGLRVIRIKEGTENLINSDIVTYKYDAKYTELPWAIRNVGKLIDLRNEINIDLDRDRFHIYEQYIQIEKENCLAIRFPEIAKQWHPTKNGLLTPLQVSSGSQKRVWWLGECGHEWQSVIYSRTYSRAGCPICSGKIIVPGINDLCTTNPSLAAEWDYEKNAELSPSNISQYSHKKVWWICTKCGNRWSAIVKNRSYGARCPVCSKINRNR